MGRGDAAVMHTLTHTWILIMMEHTKCCRVDEGGGVQHVHGAGN